MLEVQKSYQAMLRALNGDRDFVDIANKNISSLPLKKQVECIVCALGEHAAKIKETVPSTSSNSDYTAALYSELMQWNISEDLVIDEHLISKLATRLNSVVKAQQNCA